MTIGLLFGTFFVCLLIGVPIAISLGVSALVAIYFGSDSSAFDHYTKSIYIS